MKTDFETIPGQRRSILLLTLLLAVLLPAVAQEPPADALWDDLLQFEEGKEKTFEHLVGWEDIGFGGAGETIITNGMLQIGAGIELSGVRFTGKTPSNNYEVVYEARRVDGSDFFSGLTFPVGTNCCTLINGGWGGGLLGISSLDNLDASENETTDYLPFEENKWYAFRLRVTPKHFKVWVNKELRIDVEIADRKKGMRFGEIEESMPFGLTTFMSTGQIKNFKIRKLTEAERE